MMMERNRPAVTHKEPTPMDVYYCLHGQWIPGDDDRNDEEADEADEVNEIMEEAAHIPGDLAEHLQGMEEFYQRAYGTKVRSTFAILSIRVLRVLCVL
ncbi:hypothetical protein EON65_53925 [archaeon]|nr:MAG: hypothetical protein EON65_53925 [archaeon]